MILRLVKPNDIVTIIKLIYVVCNYVYDVCAHCCGGILIFNALSWGFARIHRFLVFSQV